MNDNKRYEGIEIALRNLVSSINKQDIAYAVAPELNDAVVALAEVQQVEPCTQPPLEVQEVSVDGYEWSGYVFDINGEAHSVRGDIVVLAGEQAQHDGGVHCRGLTLTVNGLDTDKLNDDIDNKFNYHWHLDQIASSYSEGDR